MTHRNEISGRIRVAREGLNSTITGKAPNIRKFIEELK